MARAAGNSSNYKIQVIDSKGKPVGEVYEFPSVTTILDAVIAKPRLLHWYYTHGIRGVSELAAMYGNRLPASDEAGLRTLLKEHGLSPYSRKGAAAKKGTNVHDEFEQAVTGAKEATHPGIISFLGETGIAPADVLAAERPLVSFTYRYAGTLDLVFRNPTDGQVILCDLKTGTGVHWTHFVQQAAYKQAWEENGGEPIDTIAVLHIPAEGKTWKLLQADVPFSTFKAALDIYNSLPLDNWYPDDLYLDEEGK